jgi:3-phosphoshikimate 1-carboxyvinyltransferase
VAAAWRLCGAIIHTLTPGEHDKVFAAVSHLPHLLAYALVDDIANKPHADLLFQYAASGFRDFTRIAGSSPEMWRDISLANRDALLGELDAYLAQLTLRARLAASRRRRPGSRVRQRPARPLRLDRSDRGRRKTAASARNQENDVKPNTTPTPRPRARDARRGTVRLPGSKSISNRTLLLAALAEGTTTIHDLLASDDTLVMLGALQKLGIQWEQLDERTHVVHGAGGVLPNHEADLFMGNAGTAIRPLTAALAVIGGDYTLHGVRACTSARSATWSTP